jgi:hypothetical protein
MPSPGAGSVTSLSCMAQFLRSKNNNPSQGYSAGAEHRDITRYQQTFQRPGSIFGPGYPLVPPSRQPIRGWDYAVRAQAARILVIECISNGSVSWMIEAIGGNWSGLA